MSVQVTPLHDRELIKRVEEKESIKGGIIIPDTAKEKPQEGEVIAAGAGKMEKGVRVPLDVKVGDRVLFGKYSGPNSVVNLSRNGPLGLYTTVGVRWYFGKYGRADLHE